MPASNGFSELAALMYTNDVDEDNLRQVLSLKYTESDLVDYLQNEDLLVARAAATALGLIGRMDVVPVLVKNLKNNDYRASVNTEESLWNIWSRSGNDDVDKMLNVGKRHIENEKFTEAIERFSAVIEVAPNFAEGYNQRAIACFVIGEWEKAIEDCKQTVKLNPYHFGAYAGMGHAYLRLGDIEAAIEAYKQALTINPNLISIAKVIIQLRRVLEQDEE